MRSRFLGALFIFTVLMAASVSAGWTYYGDVAKISDTEAKTSGGDFSLGFVPSSSAIKIDFYINGKLFKTEENSPYWMFGDYGNYPLRVPITDNLDSYPSDVTAKVTLTNGAVYYYTTKVSKGTTSSSTGSTAGSTITTSGTNLLKNAGILTSLSSFGWHNSANDQVYWSALGKNDPGSIRLLKGYDPAEAWQGKWNVEPGDKVTIKGWFKSGDLATSRPNKGVGFGVDLRNVGGGPIVFVLNGPATLNKEWTYLTAEYVVPCKGHDDQKDGKWTSSDGKSSTIDGARSGLTPKYSYLDGKNLPSTMEATLWTQIWHKDSVYNANVDNLHLEIARNVLSC